MLPLTTVTRVVQIPYYDDKPKRHKWYLYNAKIGTTNGTIVWIADKDRLEVGDRVFFVDDFNMNMSNKKLFVKYPSESVLQTGYVTDINGEPRAFIALF